MVTAHNGIFINRTHFSLNTQLYAFLTKEQGLVKAVSFNRGKNKTPIVFQMCEILLKNDAKFELPRVQTLIPLAVHEELDVSSLELFLRYFIADIIYQTIPPKTPDIEAFNFLVSMKKRMKQEPAETYAFPTLFLNGWIDILGLLPIAKAGATDLNAEQGEFIVTQAINPSAIAWNRMIVENTNVEKGRQKELLHFMLFYLSKHVPNLNVSKTLEIINQTLH